MFHALLVVTCIPTSSLFVDGVPGWYSPRDTVLFYAPPYRYLEKYLYPSGFLAKRCLNSLCSVSHSQASTRIPNPYHTVTTYDRVTSNANG